MRHSKEEIIAILDQLESKKAEDLESETLDFKQWIDRPKELYKMLVEYAVCFANHKGGTLVLGVDDKTKGKENAITGCDGYNIPEIKSRIYEATDPKILVDVEELRIKDLGVTLLLIHIAEGIGIHTTTDGTSKVRVGKDCKPLTGTMRHQKSVEMGLIDFSGEVVRKLSHEDLSKIEIERLRNVIRANKPESALLKLTDEDMLKHLGITKNNHPTIAGILLIGSKDLIESYVPSHEIIYLHMKSDIDYDKRVDYKGSLLSSLDDIYRNIELFNRVTTIKSGLFHFEVKDLPEETYREAILNAVLHRDYSESAAVFIRHYKDRIEVSNPGGFISGITPENILRQDSRPRNRHLADVLRKLGLVEKAGMGVKRIFYTQLALGKEAPVYYSDGHSVKVFIRDGSIDEHFVRFVKESEKQGKEIGLDELLILSVLRRQRELSLNEAPTILQRDLVKTREILMHMTAMGYLEKSGIKKGQIYRLSSGLYKQFGEAISYVRDKGIDEVRHPELILEYVKQYGPISNRQVRELLGLDIYKSSKLLNKLVKSGKLQRIGTGDRNARYDLADK